MEDPAVLAEFIAEAQEHLAAFTVGLLTLEELPEELVEKKTQLFLYAA